MRAGLKKAISWVVTLAAVTTAVPEARAESNDEPALDEPISEVFSLSLSRPLGMAYDGTNLWVVDRETAELCALDMRSGQVVRRLDAPGPWPAGLAWDGQLLWVADPSEERIFGVDLTRGLMVRALPSPTGTPQGLTFDGEALWLSDGRQLLRVSTEDGTTLSILPAPTAGGGTRRTEELGLAWDGNALWVADRNHDTIYRLDVREGEVIDQIPSPGPYPVGMALVGPDLYIADLDTMRVDRILISDLPNVVRDDLHEQTMSFTHELINDGPGTVETAEVVVAIPETEVSQVVLGAPQFQPPPAAIVTDQYGQRAARFTAKNLAPGKSLRVVMKVRAKLYGARYHIRPERVGTLRSIPVSIKRLYLSDSSKYRLRDEVVQKAVTDAVGDERNPYWMVRKIFRSLHKRLHYELAGGWDAVPVVLSRGSGSCSEYTMSFVSMCRAVGIPARYAGAIVVRGDDASTDWVFHRWAEVYLPNYGWVPVDAQAGDQAQPSRVGAAFGALAPRFLITTRGGGGSKHMGWNYNSNSAYTCKGRCHVVERTYGDWRRPTSPGSSTSKAVP